MNVAAHSLKWPAVASTGLAIGVISYALIAHGDQSDNIAIFVAVPALPVAAALTLATRDTLRGDAGSAAAWASTALAIVAILGLLAVPLVHATHLLFGPGSSCDMMAEDCSRTIVWPTFIPLISFLACGVGLIGIIWSSRSAERKEQELSSM